MKHFRILVVLILLAPVFAFAQSNYKAGYVVTLQGDTVKGFIDYREWDKNPRAISFKKDAGDSRKQQYSIAHIAAFGLNGYESYKCFTGWISQDNLNLGSTKLGIDTTKSLDTVFLRVVTAGNPLTLYAYRDDKKTRFFISEAGGQPVELSYHEFMQHNDDQGNFIVTQHGYRVQLNALVAKYQHQTTKLVNAIQNANYEETPLYKIVTEIDGSAYVKTGMPQRGGAQLFVEAGINSSRVSFSQDNIGLRNSSGSSIFPKIGVGVDVFLNKNVRTVSFRTEIYVTMNNANISGSAPGDGYEDIETIKFKQLIASVNPQLVYNFYNTDRTQIYVSGGFAINFNAYSNKYYNVQYVFSGTPPSVIYRDFPEVPGLNYTLTGKIGCELNKKIGIYAGYSPSTRLNDDTGYSMNLTSYYAGISYFFGK